MAVIKHKDKTYEIPEGATAEATLESLKSAVPELAGAKLKAEGENYIAETTFGRKG
jgi:hypothetical protein